MKIACIIPTYNGRDELARLLPSIDKQTLQLTLLIVDSSSQDGTQEFVRTYTQNVVIIPSSEFNHGGTRQLMADRMCDYDVYIYMTQDAYLDDPNALAKLIAYFDDPLVGAACGRQLPHLDANPLATHARLFNYPLGSRVKSIADIPTLGMKTAFMSNSFAAYRADALRDAGGFPPHVILSEDMYVAAKMLKKGWKLAYAGDACCHHSHNYTLVEEFKRYFDIGVFHGREPWIRNDYGGAGGEGARYVVSELKFLGMHKIYWWPRSILTSALKLLGYKLGQRERNVPLWLKRKLSMHKRYWDGPYAEKY
jgi:rhamnosyltransferase